ncbi:Ankyrin repeat domain-containing protein 13B [Triplophysa tibetana]|uniref:Ankyrin repeat domain-containing protein 13B n=1 Tax=Triplophysa tibetana TaxID=1572043 RepID=A0A5A9P3E4_9TELE|nr:Ankyrin repeat domain-containing protein 13B [Triplophysa tibetana]
MGGLWSRKKSPEKQKVYLTAVSSSLHLSSLKTDNPRLGADLLGADDRGRTPLHIAASKGREETVNFLLRHGADVSAFDYNGETALQEAIRSRSLEVVEMIISADARLEKSSEDLGTEMCCLAFLGETEQMKIWMKAGVSLNTSDALGRTPLHVAVCTNHPEMVKFCILNGSDPEQRDKMNIRPVDEAQQLGFHHLVELLGRS